MGGDSSFRNISNACRYISSVVMPGRSSRRMRAAMRARAVALAPARSSDISSFAASNASCSPAALVMRMPFVIVASINYGRNEGERERYAVEVCGQEHSERGREDDSIERSCYRSIFAIALRFAPSLERQVVPECIKLRRLNGERITSRRQPYQSR